MVERNYNAVGELEVLVSSGYGCEWGGCYNSDVAIDKRIIDFWKTNPSKEDMIAFMTSIGYHDHVDYCSHGFSNLRLFTVPKGTTFRIREYDGKEYIEHLNLNNWVEA